MAPKTQIMPSGEEPPAKVAKTEHAEEPAEEEELEKDAGADKRPQVSETATMAHEDSTLNIVPTNGGRVLMALSDAGLQFLVAASRSNVGVKSGRYLFEVRVLEVLLPGMPAGRTTPLQPIPRQQCRIGFSKKGSSLFLGETADSFCFDADGCFITNKQKTNVSERFIRDNVLGVLLNLDPASPNANTVSLFKDGIRVSRPQPIPEELRGQALFPHVAFRNVTLQVHFGPELMAPLPFACRSIQEAAQADAMVVPMSNPQDTKEVIFPVALPDEGTFDWLDDFMEKNPGYCELSDRKIVDWGIMSGLGKPRTTSLKNCNDKPDVSFGIQVIDELTPRKLLMTIASLIPRNYVVMEVKSNLVKADRKELLARFNFPHYKRVALVVVGEPPEAFQAKVRATVLAEKQEKVDAEWKVQQVEKKRKKDLEMKQKQLLEQRKAFEAAQRKAQEEAFARAAAEAKALAKAAAEAKAAEEAAQKAQAEAEGGDVEMKAEGEEVKKEEEEKEEKEEEAKKEEEVKEEEKKEEVKEEDAVMKEEPKEEEEETEPPKAELDEEEQKLWFLPRPVTDMVSTVFNSTFTEFTLPDTEEDFTEIRYEWATELAAKEYMRSWMQAKKITTRVEDLSPSEWFTQRVGEWQRLQNEWQMKQKEFKSDPMRQQAAMLRLQKEKRYAEKMEKEKLKAEGAEEEVKQEEAEAAEAAEGTEGAEGAEGEEKEKKADDAAGDEAGLSLEDFTPLDLYSVEDVADIGDGEPLFASFTFEDWALMNLRFELLLMTQAFKKDVPDPDRPGIHESHLPFYYNRYFRKPLNVKFFGANTSLELCELVKDAVAIKDNAILEAAISEEKLENMDILVRAGEESRRERQRRIDAGDESARLKFSMLAQQQVLGGKGLSPTAMQQPKAAWPGAPGPGAWGQPTIRPAFGGKGMGARGWGAAFSALGGKGWGPGGFGW